MSLLKTGLTLGMSDRGGCTGPRAGSRSPALPEGALRCSWKNVLDTNLTIRAKDNPTHNYRKCDFQRSSIFLYCLVTTNIVWNQRRGWFSMRRQMPFWNTKPKAPLAEESFTCDRDQKLYGKEAVRSPNFFGDAVVAAVTRKHGTKTFGWEQVF